MRVTLTLPDALRGLAGGQRTVELPFEGSTVRDALEGISTRLPDVYGRIATESGQLRTHVNLFVDGREIRQLNGLDTPLSDGADLFVLPAVSGG